MDCLILAGGLGTRLRSVVPDVPKPLAPVAGRPFIEWLMALAVSRLPGITRFGISIGYRADAFRAQLGSAFEDRPIELIEEKEALGTGGAIRFAAGVLAPKSTFVAMNGDTLFEAPWADSLAVHQRTRAQMTLLLRAAPSEGRYSGVLLGANDRVTEFQGMPSAGKSAAQTYINAGLYLIEPALIARFPVTLPSSLESDVLPALIGAGTTVSGAVLDGRFLDIGVPDDYARAAEFVRGLKI